ncbi:carboxylesterase family protein [Rhizobium sp. SL42]
MAALNWIKNNIGQFCGDAARVTLAGQSAGAWSVVTLLASPRADERCQG